MQSLHKENNMKTSELTGAALDWAVQIAEGYVQPDPIDFARNCFKPSTDWAQGGPIIERERIDVWAWEKNWSAGDNKALNTRAHGPTPLIAAMRCYVASKLGDDVDVPEELI
jgi:hypothetical protein